MSPFVPRRRRCALLLLLLLSVVAAAQDTAPNAVVIRPVANMHSGPSEDTDVVSQAILGATMIVLQEKEGWAEVRTRDQYRGWMAAANFRRVAVPYAASRAVQVVNLSANIYRVPSVTRHAPLLTVPFEARLELAETASPSKRWLPVRLPDGRDGWIQAGDVSPETRPLTIPESIELAKKFLGVTYTWGGTSSFGFDCSGFTQMLVRARGITMPRDADEQAAWSGMMSVERGALQAGDLLYFGESVEKITHTGMYIGGGEFIHDTTNTRPMVQISRLDEEPWTKLLVAARRVKP